MKLALIISAVVSIVFLAIGIYIEDRADSAEESFGAIVPGVIGMLSGCAFIALIIVTVARIIWRSL